MTRHDKNTRHETKLGRNQNSNSFSCRVRVKYKKHDVVSCRVRVYKSTRNWHDWACICRIFVFVVFIVLYMIKYELKKNNSYVILSLSCRVVLSFFNWFVFVLVKKNTTSCRVVFVLHKTLSCRVVSDKNTTRWPDLPPLPLSNWTSWYLLIISNNMLLI